MVDGISYEVEFQRSSDGAWLVTGSAPTCSMAFEILESKKGMVDRAVYPAFRIIKRTQREEVIYATGI